MFYKILYRLLEASIGFISVLFLFYKVLSVSIQGSTRFHEVPECSIGVQCEFHMGSIAFHRVPLGSVRFHWHSVKVPKGLHKASTRFQKGITIVLKRSGSQTVLSVSSER